MPTIEVLKDNAKTIGGVLGAGEIFISKKKNEKAIPPDGEFFLDRKTLDLQDVTFNQIERTKLGRVIKKTVDKLEEKIKNLQNNI